MMNFDSSGCGNHQFGCTLFSLLWQLGRPVNHAFELNAPSVSLNKARAPRAPISLATAEPFQSLDLDHIILIELRRVLLGEDMRHIPNFKFG